MATQDLKSMLRIQHPILQGPMGGGLSTPLLVASVSNLGGLGGYGAYQLEPKNLRAVLREIRTLTSKPFNINLWVNDVDANQQVSERTYQVLKQQFEPYFNTLNLPIPAWPDPQISKFEKQVEILLEEKTPVFSFVFGVPDPYVLNAFRKNGTKIIGTATTLEEALLLESYEVDAIVASGLETGGHRPSFLKPAETSLHSTLSLVQQICLPIKKTPIISAGGITNKQDVEIFINQGASGVQIGTAFLATQESGASEAYRSVLFSERAKKTILTPHFTGRLARGISGQMAEDLAISTTMLPFPQQTLWLKSLREEALKQNRNDLLTFWAGQKAHKIKHKTVAQLMKALTT